MADYKITLLKGDGIGPEIVNQAVKVLDCAAEKFGFGVTYDEALLGGCAIDATGVPLPEGRGPGLPPEARFPAGFPEGCLQS